VEISITDSRKGETLTAVYRNRETQLVQTGKDVRRVWAEAPSFEELVRELDRTHNAPDFIKRYLGEAIENYDRDHELGHYSTDLTTGRIRELRAPCLGMENGKITRIKLDPSSQDDFYLELVGCFDLPENEGVNVYCSADDSLHPLTVY
jgi:hypothetical protein